MRVTPNTTAQNSLYNIQSARSRLDMLQEKLATGQNTNRPSDDPVATRLLMGIADDLSETDQYTTNISRADIGFKMTNTVFDTMTTALTDVRSKISTIGSGMSTQYDRDNAISYLKMIKQTLIDLANTDNNGVYIFAGTNNLKQPFNASTGDITAGSTTVANVGDVSKLAAGMLISGPGIVAGTKIAAVASGPPASVTLDTAATATNAGAGFTVYGGNSEAINVEINKGMNEATNVPGNQFLMAFSTSGSPYGSTDVFAAIDQLVVDLKANNATGMSSGIKALDSATMQMNSAQVELQSRQVRINAAKTMNQTISDTLKTVLSNTQTADYAQLGVLLQQQQVAFQATLSATAKVTQMSLLDFL
ncbi:MAG: hypothetical protein PHN92_14585 [Geobacter sp.]|nr:hypothetical protein [Geobacter sp.]